MPLDKDIETKLKRLALDPRRTYFVLTTRHDPGTWAEDAPLMHVRERWRWLWFYMVFAFPNEAPFQYGEVLKEISELFPELTVPEIESGLAEMEGVGLLYRYSYEGSLLCQCMRVNKEGHLPPRF